MRTIIVASFFATMFTSNPLGAQLRIEEPGLYKVQYTFKHYYDTTDLKKVRVDSMAVYAGKQFSVYRNIAYEYYLAKLEEAIKSIASQVIAGVTIKMPAMPNVPKSEMFKKNNSREVFIKEEFLGGRYLMYDTIPAIAWDIQDETKKFGELSAQKAVGKYKGRIYTAWFCTELPISTGPWSLSGLPGTILEATDSRNHVLFLFAGYEAITDNKYPVSLRTGYVKTTKNEFDKVLKAYDDNPLQFRKNALAAKGVIISINDLPPGPPPRKKVVINNPLILSEK